MITELRLKNFKAFSSLSLPNLSRFTIFGGANNAGKTSILEALATYFGRMNPNMCARLQNWRGLQQFDLSVNTLWVPLFHNHDLNTPIEIEPIYPDGPEKLVLTYRSNLSVPTTFYSDPKAASSGTMQINPAMAAPHAGLDYDLFVNNTQQQKAHLLMGMGALGFNIEYNRAKDRAASFISARCINNPTYEASSFGRLEVENRTTELIETLRLVAPAIRSLSTIVLGNSPVIHADVGLRLRIPIHQLGDGVARLLTMLLAIANSKNGAVMIDEFGVGIHYSLLPTICSAIAHASHAYNCQIFCTTHSYELVEAAHTGLKALYSEDLSYVRLDRSGDATVPKFYPFRILEAALADGWEIR